MPRLIDADEIFYSGFPNSLEKVAFKSLIDEMPTVDAVRHGHWEKPQRHGVITYDEHAYAECSCCHKPQYLARGMNYCPNCGAKMQGDSDGNK